jgi:orotate phosphoribosyltransferase
MPSLPQLNTDTAKEVIGTLFATPSVVNLSDKDEFEVQPDVFSSIYVNMKALSSNAESRMAVADHLAAQAAKLDVEYVCGMDIGGCYFASRVADLLNKEMFFYRKSIKKYNIKNRFAGNVPRAGSSVVVIDDVLSSGNTVAPAVAELRALNCQVYVICIFSYCWDEEISKRLGAPVTSLCNAEDLIQGGIDRRRMSEHNIELIREYVVREEDRLTKPLGNGV